MKFPKWTNLLKILNISITFCFILFYFLNPFKNIPPTSSYWNLIFQLPALFLVNLLVTIIIFSSHIKSRKGLISSLFRIAAIVSGVFLIPLIVFSIWFFSLVPFYNFNTEKELETVLATEKWNLYADKKLGYSFSHPVSWRVESTKENSPLNPTKRYRVMTSGCCFMYLTFYKNTSPEFDRSILNDTSYKKENITVNGIGFTKFYYESDYRYGGFSGRHWIADNGDLSIDIIGPAPDYSLRVKALVDEVVMKIISSIKRI